MSGTRSAWWAAATSTSPTPCGRRASVHRGPARGRRRDDGRRVRAHVRRGRGAHAAPGLRADQRADRHHRGREEPHPAAGAGRRHRRLRGALQLPHRPGRAGALGRRGAGAGALGRVARPPTSCAPTAPAAGSAGPWCSTCPSTSRPQTAATPAVPRGSPWGSRPGRTRRRSPRSPAARRAERPVFIAGRGARDARAELEALADTLRRAAGHLRRRERAVRRPPVVAGDLRRLRHPPGRGADHRRRPRRGVGCVADHVDHPPRRPDRRRARPSCRSTTPRRRWARSVRSTWPCSATWPRPPATWPRPCPAARATAPRRSARGSPPRAGGHDPGTRARTTTPTRIDPRVLSAALDALLPAERTVAVDSGNFMGYPSAYLAGPGRGRVLLHPGVPVDRARARHRDRRGTGPPGPAHRRRPRRRRVPHGRSPSWRRPCGWGSGC